MQTVIERLIAEYKTEIQDETKRDAAEDKDRIEMVVLILAISITCDDSRVKRTLAASCNYFFSWVQILFFHLGSTKLPLSI
jgi:hypothetical protein